ncbi:PaaI family thioesterase [Allopusillimonas ginsengisoli]|uniref:PaaI family thioesterase n=1 Tax=Allopusillimonas ginsengisoli TaxID=453575 RepID=UPI0010C1C59B|nr:DUF4442 domain-containing protein [Allopusillimonas ginsengisoli]
MNLSLLHRIPEKWRARAMRAGFSVHPAFRRSGGRIQSISPDLSRVCIKLPFKWSTRNLVGSLYGGSLFAITDGVHVAMLLARLSRDFIVWDKAAAIRYRRPAYTTLFAEFRIDQKEIDDICETIEKNGETSRKYTVELKDQYGEIYTVVERMIYIADKAYYKQSKVSKGG